MFAKQLDQEFIKRIGERIYAIKKGNKLLGYCVGPKSPVAAVAEHAIGQGFSAELMTQAEKIKAVSEQFSALFPEPESAETDETETEES